jgi:hypothetical protein
MPALRLVMRLWVGMFLVLVVGCAVRRMHGQSMTTASGPGMSVAVGGGATAMQADYGDRVLAGGLVYVDANISPRLGAEAEAKFLRLHSSEDVTEDTYLVGIRYALPDRRLQPYAKALVGLGKMEFPFHYASGSYLVVAGGGGVDYHLPGCWTLRMVDVEFQDWPQFSYGTLHPYGVSAGLSYRITGIELFPKGTRHRH